jgi:hypothetical protein
MSRWFRFSDMHSGGGLKFPPYEEIYVEAEDSTQALATFEKTTGENPHSVACDCCGENYSFDDDGDTTLAEASGYSRGCDNDGTRYVEAPSKRLWPRYQTLEAYLARPDVLVIEMGS